LDAEKDELAMNRRRYNSWAHLLVTFAALMSNLGAHAGEVDSRCLQRLNEEGTAAWKQVAAALDGVEVRCNERRDSTFSGAGGTGSTKTKEATWSLHWLPSKGQRLLEFRWVDAGGRLLEVVNPQYRFKVNRPDNGAMYQVSSAKRTSDAFDILGESEGQHICAMEAGLRACTVRLPDMIAGSDFELREAKYVGAGANGMERVRLECAYKGPTKPGQLEGATYWAELSPGNFWQVERAGMILPTGDIEYHQEVSYQPAASSVPFPLVVTYNYILDKGKAKHVYTCTFQPPGPSQRAQEEYFLPFYGIPESVLDPGSRRSWVRVGLVAFGLTGIGVALWLSRRLRRGKLAKAT
jgi:hypothetical protein